ncbi:hypothetical protein CAF53_20310 [Sphingobium sp. LB126]|uniref:IclR family transcriptional regulator n=1 Tax=Sphingobium sp. LB126 TaxID=1983755 RepID=UPI000C2094DD|nr:IclR family transcriptional regulator C-terminal domain-containing protein [Sphingobium sp. LB126]PJG46508.1 hypothetical protein CAF53_20310 [Sphingobium sp. LB126]
MDNNYTLQTVERAIAFLEYVANAATPPNIKDVSAALNLNITTCYHLLRTLAAKQYIERNEHGGLELGGGVEVLIRGYQRFQDIEKSLSEIVKRLAAETMESAVFSRREDNNVVLKLLVEGSHRLRVSGLSVGLRGNEHQRASGKVVLAHLDPKTRAAMLDASVSPLPEKQRKGVVKTLEKEFPQIVERGWASDEQTEQGIIAICAPLFDSSGAIFGAIGIVTPTFRLENAREKFFSAIQNAAADANALLKNIPAG